MHIFKVLFQSVSTYSAIPSKTILLNTTNWLLNLTLLVVFLIQVGSNTAT